MFKSVLILSGLLINLVVCIESQPTNVILTESGPVVGTVVGKLDVFKGIPYARPPIGPLRFKHPMPVEPWTKTLEVNQFSKGCYQKLRSVVYKVPWIKQFLPNTDLSEDCLYLNVWVPNGQVDAKLPVLVFVHGGGYSQGSTSADLYDPTELAIRENVIVVTMNYRLGALGFLYLNTPEVDANAGLMDIVLSLKWVQDNIGQFGGDPDSVTWMGQSAGAMAIGNLLVSPLTKGMAKRAILLSGSPLNGFGIKDKKVMAEISRKFVDYSGCDQWPKSVDVSVQCLRELDPIELMDNEPLKNNDPFVFWPIIDGKILVEEPIKSFMRGAVNNISLMSGVVKNEGTSLLTSVDPIAFNAVKQNSFAKHKDVLKVIDHFFSGENVLSQQAIEYEYTNFADPENSQAAIATAEGFLSDYIFNCAHDKLVDIMSSKGSDVFSYRFEHLSGSSIYPRWFGVAHTSEIPFMLGNIFIPSDSRVPDHIELNLSSQMMRYVANFVRTGNPNFSPNDTDKMMLHPWPRFTSDRNHLVLSTMPAIGSNMNELHKCNFWNGQFELLRNSTIKHLEAKFQF